MFWRFLLIKEEQIWRKEEKLITLLINFDIVAKNWYVYDNLSILSICSFTLTHSQQISIFLLLLQLSFKIHDLCGKDTRQHLNHQDDSQENPPWQRTECNIENNRSHNPRGKDDPKHTIVLKVVPAKTSVTILKRCV